MKIKADVRAARPSPLQETWAACMRLFHEGGRTPVQKEDGPEKISKKNNKFEPYGNKRIQAVWPTIL